MYETKSKREVFVGLFIFIGLLFLVGGILMIGNLRETFKKKIQIVSLFDDVGGLQAGNNICFSGVKIGLVTNLKFYGKSQVIVRMKIETNAQHYIQKDAMIKISTDGLIGNRILIIYGGTPKSGTVQEGDTLRVEKTFSSEDMINTLQANNVNLFEITKDFKSISKKLVSGDGTLGKLLNDDAVYLNINESTSSLKHTAARALELMNSLNKFSEGLNTKGTLANEITTDTILFSSFKATALNLKNITDTASNLLANFNEFTRNPKTPFGILLQDEEAGLNLKTTIKNMESSSKKLEEDLEAIQHNIFLRRFFKKKTKEAENK